MGAVGACATCGTEPRQDARFCDGCGSAITAAPRVAEYKQVTVLFADVVGSMDIAKAVGPERLREIMAGILDRAATVVTRYGGTLDKFTGDGVMALFGAPVALEDHALRACRAALDIHTAVSNLAQEVSRLDGVDLRLRVGLNSGQVIAGEIGSGPGGYTAIGDQVGLAQRMESVAPPGGVMLSASTARLVEGAAVLGDPELVHIKGAEQPAAARRLVGLPDRDRPVLGAESALVGRRWQMAAVEGLLDGAIDGHGAVVTMVGSPGIGKSRLAREAAALAAARGVEVFTAVCESHTTQVPFHAVARLLRAATGVRGLDGPAARRQIRAQAPESDPEDLLLFEDLLGIADPEVELPRIDPDARRRRLTALVNASSLARESPAAYVIEDAHWIDEVSESLIADFLTVIPQTPSLVLVTYRPEYHGALTRVQGAQTIALAPLTGPETTALVTELIGSDPSVRGVATLIVERAAGNPFFAQEIVRELAERDVLQGQSGSYVSAADTAEVTMPATVQATIAARIDRLDRAAKRTLSTAAVIGSKFRRDLLETLGVDPVLDDLLRGQFIDQVTFTADPEYMFHHPLIRTVAYESQLKSDRAELHRRLAAAVEQRDPASADENAALIAEHLEAAGDAHAAYSWHMRAGEWSIARDITAAIRSWERAGQLADKLPNNDASATAMRVAPRGLLCANAFRVRRGDSAARFPELHELCEAAGDKATLAIGMTGLLADTLDEGRVGEASRLASEHLTLLESIGDATLTVGLGFVGILIKVLSAEMADAMRWSQLTIDLANNDLAEGNLIVGSPLALAMGARGVARYWLGLPGWREDLDHAFAGARTADAWTWATVLAYKYDLAIFTGVLRSDDSALREIGEALQTCEQSGDDFALTQAHMSMGFALIHHDAADSDRGVELLQRVRDQILQGGFSLAEVPLLNLSIAREQARRGDPDGVLPSMREAIDQLFSSGPSAYCIGATSVLVETVLEADLSEADTAIDRLAASVEEHQPIRDIMVLRLRTLLAKARRDEAAYRDLRERYCAMATSLGFEGHMKWAEEMQ